MRVLGVDPGSLTTGYGVVDFDGERFRMVTAGAIRMHRQEPLSERLKRIYDDITEVIRNTRPEELGVEALIFAKNASSALKLGQARGAAIVSAANAGLSVFEYAPLDVKKTVTGYGRADKTQVRHMVRTLLNEHSVTDENVSDALAVAICHLSVSGSPLAANIREV